LGYLVKTCYSYPIGSIFGGPFLGDPVKTVTVTPKGSIVGDFFWVTL